MASPAKLGLGVPFYGYVWTGGPGVTRPRQSWPSTNVPTVSMPGYTAIISGYYRTNRYFWDTNAQAPYLSITNVPAANDMFISYEDASACQCKVSYARNRGLGGLMIWELAQDFTPGQPQPLIQAIKQSLATPALTFVQKNGGYVDFDFTSLPLADYRILWSSNLSNGAWNTLTTNVHGTGGVLQYMDPTPASQPQRFYRIQTPP